MTRAPRIIGHLVVRNELSRYLPRMRAHLHELTDGCIVAYDDRSTDSTYEYLRTWGIPTKRRADDVPSFVEDESALRAAAWAYMEQEAEPTINDWILCLDADEIITGHTPGRNPRSLLIEEACRADDAGFGAVRFPVAEVFKFDDDGWPLIRTDGFWGQINATRLIHWRPGTYFASSREGGGSIPWGYVAHDAEQLAILHFGYATEKDRAAKHARYSAGTGHNRAHIESILQPPALTPWAGNYERVYT